MIACLAFDISCISFFFFVSFLLSRCTSSLHLCNFFHWYLSVETFDPRRGFTYTTIHNDFLQTLKMGNQQQQQWEKELRKQGKLIAQLIRLGDDAKANKGRVEKKVNNTQR